MSLHGPYMNQTLPEQELTGINSKAISQNRYMQHSRTGFCMFWRVSQPVVSSGWTIQVH